MAAIELYTPQGAEMVSGMIYEPYEPYEPYEQGVIMRLEHHLVGGYVRYISPHIIIINFVRPRCSFLACCLHALSGFGCITCTVMTTIKKHNPTSQISMRVTKETYID